MLSLSYSFNLYLSLVPFLLICEYVQIVPILKKVPPSANLVTHVSVSFQCRDWWKVCSVCAPSPTSTSSAPGRAISLLLPSLWLVTSSEAPLVAALASIFSVPTRCPLCGACPFPRPPLLSLGYPAFLRAPPSPSLLVPMQAWKESYSCGSSPHCLCLIKASLVFNPLPPCFSPPSHPSHHVSCHPGIWSRLAGQRARRSVAFLDAAPRVGRAWAVGLGRPGFLSWPCHLGAVDLGNYLIFPRLSFHM